MNYQSEGSKKATIVKIELLIENKLWNLAFNDRIRQNVLHLENII